MVNDLEQAGTSRTSIEGPGSPSLYVTLQISGHEIGSCRRPNLAVQGRTCDVKKGFIPSHHR